MNNEFIQCGAKERSNELSQREVKEMRVLIQDIVDILKKCNSSSREQSLAITKLEEGKMWLGKELGNLGGEDLNAKRDKGELSS